MKTATIATFISAAALIASAASVVAAQPNGRDSVHAEPSKAATSRATTEVPRFGRDSVHVTKDTRVSKPDTAKVSDSAPKPGRA
jgi:hypothetical protein